MNFRSLIQKHNLVDLAKDPDFLLDIVYATPNNFTKQQLYPKPFCLLRKSTYQKLKKANDLLKKQDYQMIVWDAFRPLSVQKKMWQLVPDERFVSNPATTHSSHCKGNTVDLGLADKNGNPVPMPTEFDHFGPESFRKNISKCSPEIQRNIKILTDAMIECGFNTNPTEWWHFTDTQDFAYIID